MTVYDDQMRAAIKRLHRLAWDVHELDTPEHDRNVCMLCTVIHELLDGYDQQLEAMRRDGLMSRMIVTADPVPTGRVGHFIRARHHLSYRSGQWARVVEVVPMLAHLPNGATASRLCYHVRWDDDARDWWPIDATGANEWDYQFSMEDPR